MGMLQNGHGLLDHATVKSEVFQEWIDELSWIFPCRCKFRKDKSESYFNNFWVGMFKNGCGLLGDGTLRSTLSWQWIDELS